MMKIPRVHTSSNVRLQRKTLELCFTLILATSTASFAVSRIDVLGGALDVGTTLSAGGVHVGTGAVLSGNGTIFGNVTVEGSIAPSASAPGPASLFVYGDVTFAAGSSFHCHAASHTQCDRLTVDGTLSGQCAVVPTKASGAVPVGKTICGLKYGSFSGFSLAPAYGQDWRLEPAGGILMLTDLIGDSDLNTLPDWFELEYFMVRTGTDPDGHGDDDGMTNREELIAGTDPTDRSSSFSLGPIVRYPAGDNGEWLAFYIEWPSVAGRQYELYYGLAVDSRTNLLQSHAATPPTNIVHFNTWLAPLFVHGTVEKIP